MLISTPSWLVFVCLCVCSVHSCEIHNITICILYQSQKVVARAFTCTLYTHTETLKRFWNNMFSLLRRCLAHSSFRRDFQPTHILYRKPYWNCNQFSKLQFIWKLQSNIAFVLKWSHSPKLMRLICLTTNSNRFAINCRLMAPTNKWSSLNTITR